MSGQLFALHEVIGPAPLSLKTPDGEDGTIERQGRDDGVDPRPILQPGIDHRARLVDATADRAHDPLDDPPHMRVVDESEVGRFQLAVPFDLDLVESIDQNVRDRRIL